MQDENNRRKTRRRTGTVEVPGQDEIKTDPPTVKQKAQESAPAPRGSELIEQVAEEAKKGNVVNMNHNSKPKIGDRWAGMVLTKHGWAVEEVKE
ncbi:hypothetical protein [Pantoea dispersa]|uniref:hypothetical protein n=1 Tax=Pantoea dispersa TaxID=59814 RepID=UPI002864F9C5|nr:hypothetical protein [Pantoea dispersa]MDR6297762.1 hypothetical protein [Pantoea dispersa]